MLLAVLFLSLFSAQHADMGFQTIAHCPPAVRHIRFDDIADRRAHAFDQSGSFGAAHSGLCSLAGVDHGLRALPDTQKPVALVGWHFETKPLFETGLEKDGQIKNRGDSFVFHANALPESVIDGQSFFCVSAGLSKSVVRTAPVSAFFCVQKSVTPSLSGVGVADGNKIQAQACNTVAGNYCPERTPAPVFGATLKNSSLMKKNASGEGTPRRVSKPANATRRVYCDINDAVYVQLVEDYGYGFAPEIIAARLAAGTLIANSIPDNERAASLRWNLPTIRRFFILPVGLAADLEQMGRRELGLTLSQSLAFVLNQDATRAFETDDDDDDGEEWKEVAS